MNVLLVAGLVLLCVSGCAYLAVGAVRRGAHWLGNSQTLLAERDLADLFIFVQPSVLTGLCSAAALAFAGLGLVLGVSPLLMGLPMLAVFLCPRWLLGALRQRRSRRFVAQLPDGLALLAGLLKAGHGLTQALAHLAQHQPAPLGQELQLVARKHRLGMPLDLALSDLHRRIPEQDVALLAMTVRVSRELGGNLAEALQRLSEGVRTRLVLHGKIDALTSQGRLQGLIVGLLPLGLMAALAVMDPVPLRALFSTTPGWLALCLIGLLEMVGFYLIRRIVKIDV